LSTEIRDGCTDSDLERLRFIPELRIVKILSDQIYDAGAACLKHLRASEVFCLYSRAITESCFYDIAQLRSLKFLDLQGSPQISEAAFSAAVPQLPSLRDIYPPRKKV
jgi:hypothetical protein